MQTAALLHSYIQCYFIMTMKEKKIMGEPCSIPVNFLSSPELIGIYYVCLVFYVTITIQSQILYHKF